jgi:hypothetical protein
MTSKLFLAVFLLIISLNKAMSQDPKDIVIDDTLVLSKGKPIYYCSVEKKGTAIVWMNYTIYRLRDRLELLKIMINPNNDPGKELIKIDFRTIGKEIFQPYPDGTSANYFIAGLMRDKVLLTDTINFDAFVKYCKKHDMTPHQYKINNLTIINESDHKLRIVFSQDEKPTEDEKHSHPILYTDDKMITDIYAGSFITLTDMNGDILHTVCSNYSTQWHTNKEGTKLDYK